MANGDRCLYYVKPGKAHSYHRGGKYSVCITPGQHAQLFGADAPPVTPTPLGCGVFACAYSTSDPKKVVKITRDETDVAALQAAQGIPGVPKLFSAYKLASYARWLSPERQPQGRQDPYAYNPYRPPARPQKPLAFGLVVERLKTLEAPMRRRWNKRLSCFQRMYNDRHGDKAMLAKGCCPLKPKLDRFACMKAAVQLHETFDGLREHGITFRDLHAGNVGRDARGRWAILDLGRASGTGPADVEDLAGARRRKVKRGAKRARRR